MKSGYLWRSSSQNLFWKQIFPSLVPSWWSNILELCKIHWPNIEMATFENCNSPSILTLVRVKPRHKIYAWEEMEGNSNKESRDSMSDRFKSKCSIVPCSDSSDSEPFCQFVQTQYSPALGSAARYRLSVFLHWINL